MIHSLIIHDMLAHAELAFTLPDANGHTTIAGESECGKSTLLEAICFVLFALATSGREFATEAIRDGAARTSVSLTTPSGRTLTRTMTRSRTTTRSIQEPGGKIETYATEEAWRRQLRAVGERPDLVMALLVPMRWTRLATEQLGRPLRDLILSLLPAGDVGAIIAELLAAAGHELHDGDPLAEAGAKALLTIANRMDAETAGRLRAAESRRLSAAPAPTGPSDADVVSARAVEQAAQKWGAYRIASERVTATLARIEEQRRQRDDWRARLSALGERPIVGDMTIDEAGLARLRAELGDARGRHEVAGRDYRRLKAQLDAERADSGLCGSCGQPLPEDRRPDPEATERQFEAVISLGREAADEVARIEGELGEADAALEPLRAQRAAGQAWDAARRAIGQEPEVGVAPSVVAAPDGEEPTPAAVASARAILDAAARAEGERERAKRDQAAATHELTIARAAATAASAEAKRAAALLDACRRAPSEMAARQQAALGGLGCVSLRFPPRETRTTPEVEVLIDGRPWELASDGRRVFADLELRAGLRRLAGLDPLPIIVDRAQDWTGEWPELPGPVWYLVSRPGEIEVLAGRPGRMARGAA
jgi:hypothetical protein